MKRSIVVLLLVSFALLGARREGATYELCDTGSGILKWEFPNTTMYVSEVSFPSGSNVWLAMRNALGSWSRIDACAWDFLRVDRSSPLPNGILYPHESRRTHRRLTVAAVMPAWLGRAVRRRPASGRPVRTWPAITGRPRPRNSSGIRANWVLTKPPSCGILPACVRGPVRKCERVHSTGVPGRFDKRERL